MSLCDIYCTSIWIAKCIYNESRWNKSSVLHLFKGMGRVIQEGLSVNHFTRSLIYVSSTWLPRLPCGDTLYLSKMLLVKEGDRTPVAPYQQDTRVTNIRSVVLEAGIEDRTRNYIPQIIISFISEKLDWITYPCLITVKPYKRSHRDLTNISEHWF